MGWLIALVVIAAILFCPLGVRAIYRQDDSGVWLLVGPFHFRVYPARDKKKKNQNASEKKEKKNLFKGGRYSDFLPVARAVYRFLEELRRKVLVKRLELKVVLAGDDPADLAINYGKAWAALGNVTPHLERLFIIKRRNLEVECDFTAEETLIYARIDAYITLMRAVHLLSKHGIKLIKEIMELKKLRKGGTEL